MSSYVEGAGRKKRQGKAFSYAYRPASSLPRMLVRLNDHGCARVVSNSDDKSDRLPFSTQLLRQHESTGKEHAGRQEKYTAYAC